MTKLLIIISLFLGTTLSIKGQNNTPKIVLNHFLVIVDSTTYEEILKSKILNSNFAYSQEKKLNGYSGIYIIGQDNYIEIFNPKSIQNEIHKPGESWICHTSMKVNQLENLNTAKKMFNYSTNEEFDELSLYFKDSTNLFTTWEMNKNHYENWSKKAFSDSVIFLTVDYNSPAESDSSRNYLFNNVAGIRVSITNSDSTDVVDYLTLIGYSKTFTNENTLRFSNSTDFIEIEFHKEELIPRITTIYMKLNSQHKSERIQIGNSELFIEGNKAIWELEKVN
ncbi:DUF5829 family protein [Fluviicola taffensis]|uniref:Uncharacterized protein n=1 Tax=Fluviicola taffensis (strain DSM 16823 / NCIMB 13979 / RW262) TaxID=755732 RepID=F2IHW9_FLUTR|nr:DUF5829 family protein [Fluviicola taffensis]AEA45928.1 hypothetical protein Fluta_3964 [Fluviicola taffensis DSM 16823]